MDSSGFFGAMVLAAGLEILLLALSTQASLSENYNSIEAQVSEMQQASFQRQEAELLFDAAIKSALSEHAFPIVDAELVKGKANSKIISYFGKLGFVQSGMCAKTSGSIKQISALSPESLSASSKVIAYKYAGLAMLQYSVTGKNFPCGKIVKGDYRTFFAIPQGYSQTVAVPFG